MEYDLLIKLLVERFPVLGFAICLMSILVIGYTIYLGSRAKKFLLKSKWLGIEITIENYNANEEKGGELPQDEEAKAR